MAEMLTYPVDNSTNLVRHREQDGNPFTGPPATDTTPAIFVPEVGARVRIDAVHPTDAVDFADRVGTVVEVLKVLPCPDLGAGFVLLNHNAPKVGDQGLYCRVSPVPASALDVECPLCAVASGVLCVYKGGPRKGETFDDRSLHPERHELFASLTGKDSGRDGDPATSPRSGEKSGTGSDAKELGTGRAAGNYPTPTAPAVKGEPAAPSGFCACGQEIREPLDPVMGTVLRIKELGRCVDCALGPVNKKIAILRADLDRPLPKVQAAERIWPAGAGEDYEL